MRRAGKGWWRCAAALAIAMSPFPAMAGSNGFPTWKPLVFASERDIDPTLQSVVSFDCRQARSSVEQMICTNLSLARSDGDVDFQYRLLLHWSAPAQRLAVRDQQRAWLSKREACGDTTCVRDLYELRWRELIKQLSARRIVLTRSVASVGACEVTRIEHIGGRLQETKGQRPDGMAFVYANTVTQVSYDENRAALRSRVGDLVRVCLTSVPKGCPPGDDRGRIYSSYNLRTRARWSLPDAEHGCGGA